ncbi:hypothetical protein CEE45_01705 [Candidatus Heimdallarchaeota archaeon B3_Heim]|nr:MAG: hypothetical protein CEE45_01705 [Candidatus Heimdallarchaeota archaeon B3_Heim]
MLFECLECNGTGEVFNPAFEQCINEGSEYEGRCQGCPYSYDCNKGELIYCDNCNGEGRLSLDPKKWKPIFVVIEEEN